jgi:hypothetical protein
LLIPAALVVRVQAEHVEQLGQTQPSLYAQAHTGGGDFEQLYILSFQ